MPGSQRPGLVCGWRSGRRWLRVEGPRRVGWPRAFACRGISESSLGARNCDEELLLPLTGCGGLVWTWWEADEDEVGGGSHLRLAGLSFRQLAW